MAALLLSFDGLDSSGKATQSRLLADHLSSQGVLVQSFSSPNYTSESGKRLKLLLQNKSGQWQKIPWQEKMKYFADNRAERRAEVLDVLLQGGIVIYDRYVPSSMAFVVSEAMQDKNNTNTREEVQRMVADYEYLNNKMPQESVSLFFDIPPKISAGMLEDRKHHTGDDAEYTDYISVQEALYKEYRTMLGEYPERMLCIACVQEDRLQPIEEVASQVRSALAQRFPDLKQLFL